jgi:hypothetical protein
MSILAKILALHLSLINIIYEVLNRWGIVARPQQRKLSLNIYEFQDRVSIHVHKIRRHIGS